MASEEWARTSIMIFDSSGTAVESVDVPGPSLERQLAAAEVWLNERCSDLRQNDDTKPRVRLFCSWSPMDGQHAMSLPPTLIKTLASVGGVFWMDVYPEQD